MYNLDQVVISEIKIERKCREEKITSKKCDVMDNGNRNITVDL